MKKIALALMILLTGCASVEKIEPTTVVKQEYILRVPPKESLTIPAPLPSVDWDKADQSDVARWAAEMNMRVEELEAKLHEIAKFLSDEQKKLDQQSSK
jgi:hypothetical protein